MYFVKLIIFSFILLISLYAPYKAFIDHVPQNTNKVVTIEKGYTINEIFSLFVPINFVNKLIIRVYSHFDDLFLIQSGEYQVGYKSVSEIVAEMKSGKTIIHKLKINEGITIYDLEKLITDSHLINDCSYLKCIQTDYPFKEGILYPDTYFYKKGMNASEILIKSYKRLQNFLNNKIENTSYPTSLNEEEILILASIIEKEAGNDNEKNKIAGVFLKRLDLGMKLQADPTIIYGLLPNFDGDIKKSDILDKNNKYNTYMINGLPPSPISISSITSINASIEARPGEYLFFVADSPNSHYFSKTYDEHLEKINDLGLNKWKLFLLRVLRELVNQLK